MWIKRSEWESLQRRITFLEDESIKQGNQNRQMGEKLKVLADLHGGEWKVDCNRLWWELVKKTPPVEREVITTHPIL